MNKNDEISENLIDANETQKNNKNKLSESEVLTDDRNKAEYSARDWRAMADEVFTFARYAKEDFDSDDLEKKRAVIVKLGENLTILDRTIQFTPNKNFLPIEEMNNKQKELEDTVRTEKNDKNNGLKSKNTPVGVLAVPHQSTSLLDDNSSWLSLQVTNFADTILDTEP